jgi:indolepyruvate ferredoxin oxidoreductase alpha subunit
MIELVSGSEALAKAAITAGVSWVSSYPGSPATYIVDDIAALTSPEEVRVEWASNEKVALEMAFGASLAGKRSLLAVKSVGLNIALDPLMTINLSGCNAGFVILLGDDPGSWGSQNEQDSRALGRAAELPVLEPTTVAEAYRAMRKAFDLSEGTGLPVIVRMTRALSLAKSSVELAAPPPERRTRSFKREFNRWVVLPVNVVSYHLRLLRRLREVQSTFEISDLNGIAGNGRYGVVAAGFAYQKLLDALGEVVPPELRILRLGTFHPLPVDLIQGFLREVDAVLVLEETAPLVEDSLRAIAQGLDSDSGGQERKPPLAIYGRQSGHLLKAGELFEPHIAAALNRFLPELGLPMRGRTARPRPSLKPLGEDCFYTPAFAALKEVMDSRGGRDDFIVAGDPGCMVRAQNPPDYLLDIKHSLGASLGMAAGIALNQAGPSAKRVVSIIGDSSFLHTGFNGLMDAAQVGARMLVLILDNGTTALSGGQPHPASGLDARGRSRRGVDLAALARAAGAGSVQVVDLDQGEDLCPALEAGLNFDGLAVIIAKGVCDCH